MLGPLQHPFFKEETQLLQSTADTMSKATLIREVSLEGQEDRYYLALGIQVMIIDRQQEINSL